MAAITMTPNPPTTSVVTGLTTSLQQVNLPPGTKSIALYPSSSGAHLQFTGTDGGSPDAALAVHVPATTWTRFYVVPSSSRAIYVASSSGTINLHIVAE